MFMQSRFIRYNASVESLLAMSPTPDTSEPTHAVMPFAVLEGVQPFWVKPPTDWGEP